MMKKKFLTGFLFLILILSACTGPTLLDAKEEEPLKTLAGREAYIAEQYEGAKILSETEIEASGFIVSEFLSGDLHSFMFFRPTEYGYSYNGEAEDVMDDMITEAYAPLGDGMYYVFLRHSKDIVSLDVTRIDGETNEAVQNGMVYFEDGDIALMKQTDELSHWRMQLVAYDTEGQEYVLADGEPPEEPLPDMIEVMEREKDEKFAKGIFRVFRMIFRLLG